MKQFALILLLGGSSAFGAYTTFNVYAALAPNAYGSASFPGWQANAVSAMENGQTTWGTPDSPTYFQTTTAVTGNQLLATGFPSWMGSIDPGTNYGPAFASEIGNRLHFPLHIISDVPFSVSMLSFVVASTDPANALGFSYAAGGYGYSAAYVGLNWGPDGARGGGDDNWITGGANTQLVNELFGRGSGNAYAPCEAVGVSCNTPAEQQAALDAAAGYPAWGSPYQISATWTLAGRGSATATVDVTPTPEPMSFALMGAAFVAFGVRLRLRRN